MEVLTTRACKYFDFGDDLETRYPNLYNRIKPLLNLKMIGFWKNKYCIYFPIPIENSRNYSDEEKEKILDYLTNNTHKKMHYLGYSECRICGCDNGCSDVMDGVYIWPSGLGHYVKDHNISLPDEFIKYILAT